MIQAPEPLQCPSQAPSSLFLHQNWLADPATARGAAARQLGDCRNQRRPNGLRPHHEWAVFTAANDGESQETPRRTAAQHAPGERQPVPAVADSSMAMSASPRKWHHATPPMVYNGKPGAGIAQWVERRIRNA